ncbi:MULTISPECIES: DUF6612 family protein [Paenibacillus]|uniref:Uncharacterized protein n=1 Tax=Paenibacillus odorifer TaxID=189426 RepID=A0A1R0WWI7_9BACL|nr:DUF6612 family protein [Paenibacillus odorifer]OMD22923.1 hypothetical protein BJP51_30975 [Paenibacillus odorifer]
MFIRKMVFIGIICMLGLTGCATNTKSGAEGEGDKRAEGLLSMSRSELAKQESYTIEMEKQEETSSKSEKSEDKHWSSAVSFHVDYVRNPYTVYLKSETAEGKEREEYISDTEYHTKVMDDLFIKQDDYIPAKEKQIAQRFIDPYDYIDIYRIDSQGIVVSEEEQEYILSIEISSHDASKETMKLMKQNLTDKIKLRYTLDKTTLLPHKVEAEIFTSLKSENLNSESVLTLQTTISNFNGIKEIVMPVDTSEE